MSKNLIAFCLVAILIGLLGLFYFDEPIGGCILILEILIIVGIKLT